MLALDHEGCVGEGSSNIAAMLEGDEEHTEGLVIIGLPLGESVDGGFFYARVLIKNFSISFPEMRMTLCKPVALPRISDFNMLHASVRCLEIAAEPLLCKLRPSGDLTTSKIVMSVKVGISPIQGASVNPNSPSPLLSTNFLGVMPYIYNRMLLLSSTMAL